MSGVLWVGIALAVSSPAAAGRQASPSRRQVIGAAELRSAGIIRLSELPLLAREWDASTVDGFTWQLSPRGLNAYQHQRWAVMVDDNYVDLEIFGTRSLNRLPITLSQIDSVVFVSAPVVRGGILADGLMHIFTRRTPEGLSLGAHGEAAAETGDPGPFRFTDRRTPNIDQLGSDGSIVIGYRRRGLSGQFTASKGGWFVSDPQLRRRINTIKDMSERSPVINTIHVSAGAGLETSSGTHRLFFGRTWIKDYYLLKPFGREVPSQSPFTHAGIGGSVETDGIRIRYWGSYSRNELQEHRNRLDVDFDWQSERLGLGIQAERVASEYRAFFGVGYRWVSAKTDFTLEPNAFQLLELTVSADYNPGRALEHGLDLSVIVGRRNVGLHGRLANRWHLSPRHSFEAAVAYTERIPEDDGRIWFWAQRGYAFLTENGIAATVASPLVEARRLSAELDWRMTTGWATVAAGVYARAFRQLALERQRMMFEPATASFSAPVQLSGNHEGEIGGASATLSWPFLRHARIESFVRFQEVVGGDSLFRAVWNTVPKQVARVSAIYRPVEGLSVWGVIDYRGSSEWADYQDAAVQSEGRYRARINGAVTVSLAVEKWFWKRRFRLNMQLRNLFNDTAPRHPIGAEYDLTFVVHAEVRFDSIR